MAKKTVLLTGFEPFGGQKINASERAVEAVDAARFSNTRLVREILPCIFGDSIDALRVAIRRSQPELVICVGEAESSPGFAVERIAINVDDARIPDNARAQPIDRRIAPRGPAAYWSTLPIKAIVAALHKEKLPAMVSETAGTFVCNHVFYGLMRSLGRRDGTRGGFIHVPCLPQQARKPKTPTLSLPKLARGLEIAVATGLRLRKDVRRGGGATH